MATAAQFSEMISVFALDIFAPLKNSLEIDVIPSQSVQAPNS